MAYIPEQSLITTFDEQVVGNRIPILDYVPTWGVSKVNYDITEISGGIATSSNSEIQLSSGTDVNGEAEVETKLIGQYQAGSEVEMGWGVRLSTLPTGSQSAEWSYSRNNEESGFGWGVDENSTYLFYINQGTKTIVSQSNWNVDSADGDVDLTDGRIFQTQFVWYGYGPIKFYVLIPNSSNTGLVKKLVHVVSISGSTSINNPNQPIRFDVKNGGSTGENFDLFIGGHQFNIVGGARTPRKRTVAYEVDELELANTGSYQPLFAIRRKDKLRGKDNSVNVVVKGFKVKTSADMSIKLVSAEQGTISNGGWSETEWGDESAVEIKESTTGNILTSSGSTRPSTYIFTTTARNTADTSLSQNREIVLGRNTEGIVYGKLDNPSDNETVKLTVDWEEEW